MASTNVVASMSSTIYESAVVFGRPAPVMDAEEKRKAMMALLGRFLGDSRATDPSSICHAGKLGAIAITVLA